MKVAHNITAQYFTVTLFACLACGQLTQTAYAASTDLASVPMAVSNSVTPNILVVLDNSQSMDGYMNGTLVAGNDPATRSNIGRSAMRNLAITPYRTAFNWGLMSFATSAPSLMGTYVYYLGDTAGMNFTSSCSGYVAPTGVYPNQTPAIAGNTGVCTSATPGNCSRSPASALWTQFSPTGGMWTWHDSPDTYATWTGNRCIANPQPQTSGTSYAYLTIDYSSDDFNINDVLYFGGYASTPAISQAWAPATNTSNPTSYKWWKTRSAAGLADTTWNSSDFDNPWFSGTLTPTDAGYIPSNTGATLPNDISRSLYLPRGWGYDATVSGGGTLNETVQVDSTTHYNNLMTYLGNETNGATGEIKNAAEHTPTAGTLASALSYFSGGSTPIRYACQQNFVMLVTDGLPTGTGNYTSAQLNNTCVWNTATNSCSTGSLSTAVNDVITQLTNLRATSVSGHSSTNPDGTGTVTGKYDIQTYVVGLGDTVVNANNFSALNAMAYYGGGMNQAMLATDTTTFNTAINAITSNIVAKIGSAAAVGVANAQVTSTNNESYSSTYNSGTWAGDLNAYPINLTTGLPGTTSLWPAGSAQAQLDALSYPGGVYNATNASTVRYIVTSTDVPGATGGVEFQPVGAGTPTTVSTNQQTLLNTPSVSPVDGAAVLAYLRGDRTGEPSPYRARAHLLGDIVNASPVVVSSPSQNFSDNGYEGTTSTFKESHANRASIIYQGANDGMLHAFNALTGAELWAYIPNLVMGSLNNLSSKSAFIHQYRVDGTPVPADVDLANVQCAQPCANAPNWHTILVGGLGKGGRGYYALDITSSSATSEAAVASKVMWEFPNSITNSALRAAAQLNTGYSFGKPAIVKTKAAGWVVLVTSGYNNGTNVGDSGGDGLGHLYVLNPVNGDLISDIPTAGCTATPTANPCGLAQISAFVANSSQDMTTDYVYGGDLYGNVWRFDLSGTTIASWNVANMAVLKDPSGSPQPITAGMELGTTTSSTGNSYRFVYVGTGKYLGNSDVSTTQIQTMYGLIDPKTRTTTDPLYTSSLPNWSLPPNTHVAGTLRSNLVGQTLVAGSPRTIATTAPVDPTVTNGWYLDLNLSSGERVVTHPVLADGVLTFTTDIPSSVVCVPGGSSWLYNISYSTGGTFTNPSTGTTAPVGTSLGSVLASQPVLIVTPDRLIHAVVRTSNGGTVGGPTGGSNGNLPNKRVSWHELVQ